jgi:2-iminobutanoate/2-iminopropanoate deaminase
MFVVHYTHFHYYNIWHERVLRFMKKSVIKSEAAPSAIGPYSQAIVANGMVFTAGQTGSDPATKKLVEGGITEQTRQTLKNVKSVLEAAGVGLENVVKTTVFLADMNDFSAMNAVYGEFFPEPYPARSTVQVARLPGDALVEIEAVAVV